MHALSLVLWFVTGVDALEEKGRSGDHSAVSPVSREAEAWWKERLAKANERVRKGDVDLLFIGDSITQGWEDAGKTAWEKHFTPHKAVNLGFSGDRTQHVLWRLDHGNVAGISPKAAVVMIGTNNSNGDDNSAQEIADGIQAIVKKLRERLPSTRILLLAVFPRGEKPDAQREKLERVNEIIAKLHDGKMVHFLDIGGKLMNADGTISAGIMPDFLHLSPKGYENWAEAISAQLATMLQPPGTPVR